VAHSTELCQRKKFVSVFSLPRPAKLASLATGLALFTSADTALASDVQFGPNDVTTVFFIDKSDDHNRVDYGMRLTANCAPVNDDALFPYWREFEHPPVHTHGLGMLEYVPYGFSEQRMLRRTPTGGLQLVRLKQLDRLILISTKKEADGHCSAQAQARINGVDHATLVSVYAKLAGAMSVDYIDVHGKNPDTGTDIVERIKK
jgi:hypothetical protein